MPQNTLLAYATARSLQMKRSCHCAQQPQHNSSRSTYNSFLNNTGFGSLRNLHKALF